MMRKLVFFIAILMPALGSSEPLRVFVSVPPQKTFVEKVGAHLVEVHTMVRPGHNPHTYDPTPQQISALSKTALYLRIGVPFENAWMERIRSANPDMRVLDNRTGIDLRSIARQEHEHHEKNDGHQPDKARDETRQTESERDPHVWTSPPLVKQMARNIRDALAELDPPNRLVYARNYGDFAAELDTLDRDIRSMLKDISNQKFMVFHPSWGYFADTYGLTQVPIEKEGKQPGARALTALIEQAKREQVKVIFVQPQFDKRSAKQVARAIGGRVVPIDPLAADYADNLREVARLIAEAVQR